MHVYSNQNRLLAAALLDEFLDASFDDARHAAIGRSLARLYKTLHSGEAPETEVLHRLPKSNEAR
jgi:hypothetical protein